MKVHHFARAGSGLWDHHQTHNEQQHSFLSLGCKRLRPLAPKLDHPTDSKVSIDLKTFIKSDKLLLPPGGCDELDKKDSAQHQVETQNAGGTRWNPTQEQIGILEKLYRGGMRTPNAQQIEQITQQLSKYGKIEGKNVFYWFQNHKARERQKMKRSILGLSHRSRTPPLINTSISLSFLHSSLPVGVEKGEVSPYKRNCTSWAFDFETSSSSSEENNVTIINSSRDHDGCKLTLELFPLHPELRQMI